MSVALITGTTSNQATASTVRSVDEVLAPLNQLARHSSSLLAKPLICQPINASSFALPQYLYLGPQGGADPIRIGLFAGIHGDEPAGTFGLIRLVKLLEAIPEPARGYCLFIYPVCNPTGFEAKTRHSRHGYDLNREFWLDSTEPEVLLLQREILAHSLHGIISLHSDDTSQGLYGYARGATFTEQLLDPALAAADTILPRNQSQQIDGFHARQGIIDQWYAGVLGAPAWLRPKPFEIILETPLAAPLFHQETAFAAALLAILNEYRKFMAYGANL